MDSNNIDLLAENAVKSIKHAEHYCHPDAFRELSERLISAGKSKNTKVMNRYLSDDASSPKQSLTRTNPILDAASKSGLHKNDMPDPLERKKSESKGLGRGWFDFEPLVVDDKLRRDLSIIQMRNYLDPKRFYKNPDKQRPVLHIGTVIEGAAEYKSARITNKNRRQTIVDEILADSSIREYTKRKFMEIQKENASKARRGKSQPKKYFKSHKKLNKLY